MLSFVYLLSQDRHKGSQHGCVSAGSQFLFPSKLRQCHEQLQAQQGAAQPGAGSAGGEREYGNAAQPLAIARSVAAAERCHPGHGVDGETSNQSVNLLQLINSKYCGS